MRVTSTMRAARLNRDCKVTCSPTSRSNSLKLPFRQKHRSTTQVPWKQSYQAWENAESMLGRLLLRACLGHFGPDNTSMLFAACLQRPAFEHDGTLNLTCVWQPSFNLLLFVVPWWHPASVVLFETVTSGCSLASLCLGRCQLLEPPWLNLVHSKLFPWCEHCRSPKPAK